MSRIKYVEYTGTGAALGIDLGFVPSVAKIYDNYGGLAGMWGMTMEDGECVLASPYIDSLISSAAPGIGTTAANCANKAFQYTITGIPYNKAATAAGTAPTATTVPQNLWGAFGFELASDGTLDHWDAAANATGYATEALAIAGIRAVAASGSHVRAFFFTVMRTNAAGFVGATTSLADTETTVNYYNFSDLRIYTGGITVVDESEYLTSGTILRDDGTSETPSTASPLTMRGIQIGTSAYLNTVGAVYGIEAILE